MPQFFKCLQQKLVSHNKFNQYYSDSFSLVPTYLDTSRARKLNTFNHFAVPILGNAKQLSYAERESMGKEFYNRLIFMVNRTIESHETHLIL